MRRPAERALRHGPEARAERLQAPERGSDDARVERAGRERVGDAEDRVPRRVQGLAHEDHVAAGREGRDGRPPRRRARGDRVHLDVVAEEDAAEPEPAPEEVPADLRRERRGPPRVERRVDDVRRHEGRQAGARRTREGDELAGGERAAGLPHARQDEVRVARARAVSREVLPARKDAFAKEPAREREPEAGDARRVRIEGAVADHAIAGVRAHVEDGREVEVDADGAQLPAHRAPDGLGEPRVAARADGRHRREVREGRGEAVDAAPLVVDRHERHDPGAELVQGGDQVPQAPGAAHVALEQDDAARTKLLQEGAARPVEGRPREVHHDELGGGAVQHGGRHGRRAIARSSVDTTGREW
jgi:hypothetical protein